MNHYCTLFDSNYLTRGLAMYNSLQKTGESFKLYIVCFDQECYDILFKMNLSDMQLISLQEFETEALLKVKKERSKGEYCWTCTPFVIGYVLNTFELQEVTYLDADLFFFDKPSILLEEFRSAGKSTMITEHRYAKEYDQSDKCGTYCVQFMTFKPDKNGQKVLEWWQERCLEWCYNRIEDGKFGDQKYLDEWPEIFEGVHVLSHLGGGVAPWNVKQYYIGNSPSVDNINIIFYHFHALKWYHNNRFDLSEYYISNEAKQYIYYPYLRALEESLFQIKLYFPLFNKGVNAVEKKTIAYIRHCVGRRIRGNFNLIKYK